MRTFLAVCVVVAAMGCSSSTPERVAAAPELEPTVVPAPLEAVWWAIIDVVGEYDLQLETMDLGRGYLRSEPTTFVAAGYGYWECSPKPATDPDGVLSIRAIPVNDGETSLQVAAMALPADGRFCQSNGVLEAQVGERVYQRWRELTQ